MTISSVNLAMSASSYGAYNQKITAATKAKLQQLGISVTDEMTEAQGQALLKTAPKKAQNEQAGNSQNKSLQSEQQKKNDTYERALKLAEKLGITVDRETTGFKELLNLIERVLEGRIMSAQNDTKELKELRELSQELANIQAQAQGGTGYDSTNKALEMSLEMLSLYNQNFLNK